MQWSSIREVVPEQRTSEKAPSKLSHHSLTFRALLCPGILPFRSSFCHSVVSGAVCHCPDRISAAGGVGFAAEASHHRRGYKVTGPGQISCGAPPN